MILSLIPVAAAMVAMPIEILAAHDEHRIAVIAVMEVAVWRVHEIGTTNHDDATHERVRGADAYRDVDSGLRCTGCSA